MMPTLAMNIPQDLAGKVFGNFIAIRPTNERSLKSVIWECRCRCGHINFVPARKLKVSLRGYCVGCSPTKGCSRHPLFKTWGAMIRRCTNRSNDNYRFYGGKGIRVCARWLDFDLFASDMGERPSSEHTLDRIDGEGNYCPENCRWATRKEQQQNKASVVKMEFNGRILCVSEWARVTGLGKALYARISRGWSVHDALTTPLGKAVRPAKNGIA